MSIDIKNYVTLYEHIYFWSCLKRVLYIIVMFRSNNVLKRKEK